jgi:leucyl-tRNA synthetase
LLYSRFWHKVLFDRGHVSTPEPFERLVNQGMILGEVEFTGYVDANGTPVSTADVRKNADNLRVTADGREVQSVNLEETEVEKKGEGFVRRSDPSVKVDSRAFKMSKSRGNVVNPDAVVREYGADALRLYEMFMGPLEATKPWSMAGVGGVRNFLDRVWRMVVDDKADQLVVHPALTDQPCDDDQRRLLHQTIKKVSEDTESMSFNTAIARMMEFTNHFTRAKSRPTEAIRAFLLILSPYAPHLCEELWQLLGGQQSISKESWPQWDESALVETSVELPVQINGKVKAKIHVAPDADKQTLIEVSLADAKIQAAIAGKQIVKQIVVPGRLVNLVVK